MHFSYHPENENGCGHPERCPYLDGSPLGFLVTLQTSGEETRLQLHKQLDAARKRSSDLVGENICLEEKLAQAKLELKLERQNKFATNVQKSEDKDEPASEPVAQEEAKKRGAPMGHPGWFRPTPTQYDWLVEVAAPGCCAQCGGCVSVVDSADAVDHLQEDIIDNVYRVILYRHQAGQCDECRRWVQKAGKYEILNSRLGPFLRSRTIWLRNVIGISYRKIPQIIEEMHGIRFTPAALIGFETLLADKAQPLVDDIAKKLASSDGAVHADETYWTTDGARTYFWVHCDQNYVHFQYDTSRAGEVSRSVQGDDFGGTLVTDCYSGYSASAAGAKQKCLAHLARTARDWQKLTETDSLDHLFFEGVKQFVKRGCAFHRLRSQDKLPTAEQAVEKAWLRAEQSRLEACLVEHEKALTLQARILRHTLEWLVFLDDPRVEPTNNRAERDLRPLVVLRKITFGSRSDDGARRMASIMTVGETTRRQGLRASQIYFELFTRPPDRVLRKLYGGQ